MKSAGAKIVDRAFGGLTKAKAQLEKALDVLALERSNVESQQDDLRVQSLNIEDYANHAADGIKNINAVLPKGFE